MNSTAQYDKPNGIVTRRDHPERLFRSDEVEYLIRRNGEHSRKHGLLLGLMFGTALGICVGIAILSV